MTKTLSNQRNAYGEELAALGKENPDVVALEADLGKSTMSYIFGAAFPERYFEMGIAEQNMMSTAAGLAAAGKIAFASSFAVFAFGRAYDQIRQTISIGRLNVKICGSSAGLSDFGDGSTHQAIEDVAVMCALPNMTVFTPCDANETRKAVRAAASVIGPVYIRVCRNPVVDYTGPGDEFIPGRLRVMRSGSDVVIFAYGVMLDAAMDAAKQVNQLENMITQGVDVLIITPVDVKALPNVIAEATKAGIPVITESNVVPGTKTYVGIDNKTGGLRAGLWFAEYARANNIDPKIIIVGLPAFEDCRLRVEGFKEGMNQSGLRYTILQEVDGQGSKETSLRVAQDAITAHPDVNVIFGINDNSTTGGMAAYKEAGLDESKLTAIGFGFEGVVGREALLSNGPYKAAVAMFPDYMGVSVVDAALKAYNKEPLPANYESGTVVITQQNFSQFYTRQGNDYATNFEAIRALMNK